MMNHTLSLPIHTPRLTLRDFCASDFARVFAYASDPEVTRFMFYGPRDKAETQGYLQRMLRSQTERPRLTWEVAVLRTEDARLIGACDLTIEEAHVADLGYILACDAWGQGYATELARTLLRVGFEQLRLHRIFAICDIHHMASVRVLEKAGLQREATLFGYKEANGRSWDMHRYALTYHEWRRSQSACHRQREERRG
jgi:[ribosomal protein S5]-alanine N-acetyltransferase